VIQGTVEFSMAIVKLPLSGNVAQAIWTAFLSPFNNQIGLINISLGRSSAPAVEEAVLSEVGSYGKQLGRVGDALTVLVRHFHPEVPLSREEQNALDALRIMLDEIADVKEQHERQALRP
jgi:hypothetical protein